MEEFMDEIRAYARARGLKPSTVVQAAGISGGATWGKWERGGSCTLRTVARVRAYIAAHPPKGASEDASEDVA